MLDLSQNNPQDSAELGYEFQVMHPNGEPLDAHIKVRGELSRTVQSFRNKALREYESRKLASRRKGQDDTITIEEANKWEVDSAVARIISWRGIGRDGQEIPFTVENATSILKDNAWISKQIIAESELITNFR